MHNAAFRWLERIGGDWTDQMVVINREDAKAAGRLGLVPGDRLWRMPGIGLDLDHYKPETVGESQVTAVRQELGLEPHNPLLLMIAEFIPRKRQRDVLRAFHRLSRPQVHVAFAGDGPLRPKMERLARNLGLENRAHFLGFRRDIPRLLRTASASILASEHEGLPRSVMESMALRTPVVATRIRGTAELLEGGCGVLYELGDVDGLAAALAHVLDNPLDAAHMAELAAQRIQSHGIENVIGQHVRLYDRALSELAADDDCLARHHPSPHHAESIGHAAG
jgi:glycosyltransferase involved in cell wall biosynthesis